MIKFVCHISARYISYSCCKFKIMPKRSSSGSSQKRTTKKRKTQTAENIENESDHIEPNKLKATSPLEKGDEEHTDTTSELKLKTPDGRPSNLKIASFNVAGVRAWVKKNGHQWLLDENPDIICLQETKCSEKDIPQVLKDMKDYKLYWNVAKVKKGFSGVALMSKSKPIKVDFGIGVEEHDQEGRTITAEYEKFYLVTTYVPNSQRALKRLEYRLKWNEDFLGHLLKLDAKKPVVLCGDMNVSHLEIDLSNPKSNKRNAGFTQEERDGMATLLKNGFVDTFRHLYPDLTHKYTFWTYMGNARAKNVGWRLDYFIVSEQWKKNVCDSIIAPSAMGSDHCPIVLLLAIPE